VILRVNALVTGSLGVRYLLLLGTVLRVQIRREALLRRVVLKQTLIFLHLHIELLQVAQVLQVKLQIVDFLRRQLLAHLEVQILSYEAHRHYCFGNAGEAQLLAVHSTRVRHEDGHRHLFGLDFVLRQLELEHLALVAEVNFFLLRLVRKWNARDKRSSWLGLDVQQKVPFGIKPNIFLPRVVVGVEGVHEKHLISYLLIAIEPKVQVYLLVVLPDLALLVRLLQLVVPLLRLLLVFLALGGGLGDVEVGPVVRLLLLHVQLRLAVDAVHYYVVVVQVALDHLDLRVRLGELLVVAVTAENDNLEMLGEVAEAINRTNADPHMVHRLLGLLVVVVGSCVRLLLKVLS
jgi:hypothetical protein